MKTEFVINFQIMMIKDKTKIGTRKILGAINKNSCIVVKFVKKFFFDINDISQCHNRWFVYSWK